MRGIAGIFKFGPSDPPERIAPGRMLGTIRYRGSDQFGIYLGDEVGVGSARLSIVDLAAVQQPISNEDGTLWIVFNGEVFNPLEIFRLCRRDSRSLTVPGMWVEGNPAEAGVKSRRWGREKVVVSCLAGEQNVRMEALCGSGLHPCERDPTTCGLQQGAERSPAGPSGLGPLHLRQASGFAGGR